MALLRRYRLALDVGSTSIGWAVLRLASDTNTPTAIMKAGVRIFPDGRNPKDGTSLAVTRRQARSARRRRDRLLKRKNRMLGQLIELGFFPATAEARKELEKLNPYELRARGLDEALTPAEFARALFHINQRRGFKSNRKTDKNENENGALKTAIKKVKEKIENSEARTIGEYLYKRMLNGETVRARLRQTRMTQDNGRDKIEKNYDLYIDRSMIEDEFEQLWQAQVHWNPVLFNESNKALLKNTLLFQRNLKPVKPGRCTFLPELERAPLALPSVQLFRIYQEVNNLRYLDEKFNLIPLNRQQRDSIVEELNKNQKRSFDQIRKKLGFSGAVRFNIEDDKRQDLNGNKTASILAKKSFFGNNWFTFPVTKQDEIVQKLLVEEDEAKLIEWLINNTDIDEVTAESLSSVALPDGYGSLSYEAIGRILPYLQEEVITYDKAVLAAGFDHHSMLDESRDGEVHEELPYYGLPLERHVGFGSGKPEDSLEKRYGKIANPTVHIGLNQIRIVVNALIKKYGHPTEVVVEVARDLKQSKEQKDKERKQQAENQRNNARRREQIAGILGISEERVSRSDIQKMILWEELAYDPMDRKCPYSGVQISASMLFSPEVEIEHILPYSRTLDDGMNNKTLCMRLANRYKANKTPYEAFGTQEIAGFNYDEMVQRSKGMKKEKSYRFLPDGYELWLKNDKDFLARALNDTRYLSKLTREYIKLICPNTWVIPGQMTARLRSQFGLNDVLGLHGEKNRNDHRHHAVDACVIGITDRSLLQQFSRANQQAREKRLERLVENLTPPWKTYREHVEHAVNNIWVSHKPDHSHEGRMHNDTAYSLLEDGYVGYHKNNNGQKEFIREKLAVIKMTSNKARERHGVLPDGSLRPYKGYKGDSNYCLEIVKNEKGKWDGEIVSTFEAYQVVRKHGDAVLRNREQSISGKPLVMRLIRGDILRCMHDDIIMTLRVAVIKSSGQMLLASHQESNVDARNRDKDDPFRYISKTASSLQKSQGRKITISPIGQVNDPGFKD